MTFIKKRELILASIASFLVLFLSLGFIYGITNPRVGGRDTVLSLGDGTYQILKVYYYNEQGKMRIFNLTNVISNDTVVNTVIKYKIIKKRNLIYVIGRDQPDDIEEKYTILNYKTGEYNKYESIEEIPENHRTLFEDIEGFKTPY